MHEGGKEKLILAKALVEKVFRGEEVKVVETFKGKKLKGQKYQPLFTFLPPDKPAHFVVLGDFVTTEDGTGLVHMAPAFGAEDMEMAKEHDLPVLMTVCPMAPSCPRSRPGAACSSRMPIRRSSKTCKHAACCSGQEDYTHTYPFCWRCDTPLDVLRPRLLVYPHQPVQGPPGGAEQHDQLGA